MAAPSNFLGINTGLDAKRATITLPGGIPYVLCYVTDTGRLWFFDGVTTGGIELALSGDLPSSSAPLPVGKGGTGAISAGATAANNVGALAIANNLSDLGALTTAQNNLGLGRSENRIINGDMLIDQRNAGGIYTNPATNSFTLDRWKIDNSASAQFAVQQTTSAPPASFSNYVLLTATAANSFSSATTSLFQRIEGPNIGDLGFGTSSAKTIFLSFWVKASATGTLAVWLRNSAVNRSLVANVTITAANTWQHATIVIPGDTAGTWLTAAGAAGLDVGLTLGAAASFQVPSVGTWEGANYLATSTSTNFLAMSGATLALGHVCLRAGSVDAPYSPRPYADELALCARYYQSSFPPGTAAAQAAGKTGAFTVMNAAATGDPSGYVGFRTSMMAVPAITTYNPVGGNANWRDLTTSADVAVSVDPQATAGPGGFLLATSGTVATQGDVLAIHWSAQAEL